MSNRIVDLDTFPEVDKCHDSLTLFINHDFTISDLLAILAKECLPSLTLCLDNISIVSK